MDSEINDQIGIDRGLKLLAKSSIVVFITLLFSKLLVYLYRIIIARHYGPGVYGLFSLSIMLVGFFRLSSNLGLKQGVLRYISIFRERKEKEKIQYIFNKTFFFLIITSISAGFLLFFLSDFIALKIFSNSDLIIFLRIFSVLIPFAVLGEYLLSVLRAYEKIGWFSFISNILGNFVTLAVLVFFVFFGMNSSSVPISYILGIFFVFIAAYSICRFKLSEIFIFDRKNKSKDKKTFNRMFSYSWPFIFQGFMLYTFYWVDSFILGISKTINDVGFYNAAIPIAMLLVLPLNLFGQLFFPLVTKEYTKGNMKVVKQLSQQVGKWIFMLTAPFFILFVIFPGVFIKILFGPEFLVAEDALRFLSIGALFLSVFGISEELISIRGKSKVILFDMIIASITNVILNLIFIPLYGITGAGLATMLSLILLNILFCAQSYKYLSIVPLRRKMLKISLILIFSTVLLLIVRSFIGKGLLSLILAGIFFFAVYILLIFTTNSLDKNDWFILRTIYKKFKIKRK